MSSLIKVEKILCKLITQNVNIPIFNTVPEDPDLPMIRIGDVEQSKWLLNTDSYHASFNIAIYADLKSNVFLFDVIAKIQDAVSLDAFQAEDPNIKYVCVSDASIRQLQEDMSIAEMRLEIKFIKGDENESTVE